MGFPEGSLSSHLKLWSICLYGEALSGSSQLLIRHWDNLSLGLFLGLSSLLTLAGLGQEYKAGSWLFLQSSLLSLVLTLTLGTQERKKHTNRCWGSSSEIQRLQAYWGLVPLFNPPPLFGVLNLEIWNQKIWSSLESITCMGLDKASWRQWRWYNTCDSYQWDDREEPMR